MTPLETRAGGRELRNAGLRRSLVAETDSPFRSLPAQTTRRSNALTGSAAESRAVSPTTSTSNCKRNVPRTTERPVCVRFQSTGKVEPVAGRERASDGARGKRRCPRPDPSRRLAFVARQLQEPLYRSGRPRFVLADVRRGIWRPPTPEPQPTPAAEPSFHEFAAEWLAGRELEGLAAKTLVDLRWSLELHLLPFFAGLQLSEITPQVIDRFKIAKARERAEIDANGRPPTRGASGTADAASRTTRSTTSSAISRKCSRPRWTTGCFSRTRRAASVVG